MNEHFYIENLGDRGLWVVILSTEMTSVYWNELQDTITQNRWSDVEVYFDFLYRNGFSNRFYKSRVGSTSKFMTRLQKCECSATVVTDHFFSRNVRLLDGSVLSSLQKSMYIKRITR